ncbi:g1116 [Coccomyxa elongata]
MPDSKLNYRRRHPIQQPIANSSYSCAATPLYSSALAAAQETHMRRLLSEGGGPTLGPAWTTFSFRLPSMTASPAVQWTPIAKNLTTIPYRPAFSLCRSPEVSPSPDPTAAPAFPAYSGSPAAKQPMPPLCKQTHIRSFSRAMPPSPLEHYSSISTPS